jgi:mitochondrial GTPase 1
MFLDVQTRFLSLSLSLSLSCFPFLCHTHRQESNASYLLEMASDMYLCMFNSTRWFPGHMHKGMKDLEECLVRTDGIIEVHDARIPYSGRNPQFYSRLVSGNKPHLLLLNKSDLADANYFDKSIEYIRSQQANVDVVHTNLSNIDLEDLTKIFARLFKQIVQLPRYSRSSTLEYNIVVCGIPNVGKSTLSKNMSCQTMHKYCSSFLTMSMCLVNKLRNLLINRPNSERVGASPGVTRNMSEKVKISTRPKVFIRDTPGILEPRLKSPDESFRLLLTNCIPIQHRQLADVIADYGLFLLNRHDKQRLYMKHCQLDRPVDDILSVLLSLAKVNNCTQTYGKERGYDLVGTALHFIHEFNRGTFGKSID